MRAPDSLKDWPHRVQRYGRSSARRREESRVIIRSTLLEDNEFKTITAPKSSFRTSVTTVVTNQGTFSAKGGLTQVTCEILLVAMSFHVSSQDVGLFRNKKKH